MQRPHLEHLFQELRGPVAVDVTACSPPVLLPITDRLLHVAPHRLLGETNKVACHAPGLDSRAGV